MQPDDEDAARLWDMLTYAKEIQHGASRLTFAEYLADDDRRLAAERRLEIIGEAARHVSPGFMHAHPDIPWRGIVGLRNVLAHEYGEVKHERVYRIIRHEIPNLVKLLEELAPRPLRDDAP